MDFLNIELCGAILFLFKEWINGYALQFLSLMKMNKVVRNL